MQKLAPGEIKILQTCQDKPQSFTYLSRNVLKSSSILTRYLKKLQKEGLIERDVDTRLYRTTQKGKNLLTEKAVVNQIENSTPIPINEMVVITPTHGNSLPLSTSLPFATLSTVQKTVPITGFIYLNQEHKPQLSKIKKELKETLMDSFYLQDLFLRFGEALCNVYLPPKPRGKIGKLKHTIMQQKIMMDVDAVLLLRFNGKSIADKVDWRGEMKRAEEIDQMNEVTLQLLKKLLRENKDLRGKWLTVEIIEAASNIHVRNIKDTEEKIIKKVLSMDHLRLFSKKEVAEKIKELTGKGIIQIAATYTIEVNSREIDTSKISKEISLALKNQQT